MSTVCVGIDTGGTFTDVVAAEVESGRWFYHKVPTTTADPALEPPGVRSPSRSCGLRTCPVSELVPLPR